MLTTTDAARLAGVARVTVLKWIARGHLPAVKLGRDWLIKAEDLEALARPRKTGRPKKQ